MKPETVINFWMEAGPSRWFTRNAAFDGVLDVRFGGAMKDARLGAFDHWGGTPAGALGLVILLDQIPRNTLRGSPLAFASDAKALSLVKDWIGHGYHWRLPAPMAAWFVLPYEHAEDIDAQQRGVALFNTMGLHENAHWARVHLDVIAKFGRFPHRNPVLGRKSTSEERAFLAAGGFAG